MLECSQTSKLVMLIDAVCERTAGYCLPEV